MHAPHSQQEAHKCLFLIRLIDSQGVELDAQETRISILAHTRSASTLQRADHLRSSAVTVPGAAGGAAGSLGAASSESAVGFGRLSGVGSALSAVVRVRW